MKKHITLELLNNLYDECSVEIINKCNFYLKGLRDGINTKPQNEIIKYKNSNLENKINKNQKNTNPKKLIFEYFFNELGITEDEIVANNRKRKMVDIRFMISNYLREKKLTLEEIGKILHRDHSTIIYNINSHNNLIKTNYSYQKRNRDIYDNV